jgi:hypothetical protein
VSAVRLLFDRSIELPRPIRGEKEAGGEPGGLGGEGCCFVLTFALMDHGIEISRTRWEKVSKMMTKKVCAAILAIGLMLPVSVSSGRADGLERVARRMVHRHQFAGRTVGPRSEYAPVRVIALFDSCWRYREGEPIWTCRNYVKPNAEFDWGYGHSIADQSRYYGYPW